MPRSLALAAYLALTARAEGWGRRKLERRLAEGREDPDRISERRGEPSLPRPAGRLVWFHAASVGEALSLLELIRRLLDSEPDLTCLVTTGTVTSAEVLAARLPARCIHQFVPIDIRAFVRSFLDHWRPDLAIWTESELWPTLIIETHATGCKMLILNARMSDRSAGRWSLIRGAATALLSRFSAAQTQDASTAAALRRFGMPASRVQVTGTLKEGTPPPPCDDAERSRLTKLLQSRLLWLAASTHPGEEKVVLQAHARAARSLPRLLLILVPRHPERGDELAEALGAAGLRHVRRRKGQDPDSETQVWLADTLGELGLWYRLAPVSFVAGSLVEVGGHNPFEPAALGSAIIHGPHVRNFQDIYERLDAAGAAREISDADTLAEALRDLVQPDVSAPMALAAWELCSSGAEVTDKALDLVIAHLPPPRSAAGAQAGDIDPGTRIVPG